MVRSVNVKKTKSSKKIVLKITMSMTVLCKEKNKLANIVYRWRGLPSHPCHSQLKEANRKYADLIEQTKKEHWEEWLTNASERDIWTVNKYATNPPSDGSRTRIPNLNTTDRDGAPCHTMSNAEKSEILAKSFFPPPSPACDPADVLPTPS